MWKKWVSLNLAILMTVLLIFPAATPRASARDLVWGEPGYIKIQENNAVKVIEIPNLASNASLQLYRSSAFKGSNFTIVGHDYLVTGFTGSDGNSYEFTDMLRDVAAPSQDEAIILTPDRYPTGDTPCALCLSPTLKTEYGKSTVVIPAVNQTVTLPGDETFIPQNGKKAVLWSSGAPKGRSNDAVSITQNTMFIASEGLSSIAFHVTEGTYYNVYTQEDQPLDTSYNNKIKQNGRYLLGWNSKEAGDGSWYASGDLATEAPTDLYMQYQDTPLDPYYVLHCDTGLSSGQMVEVHLLQEDTPVTLPSKLKDAQEVVCWSMDKRIYLGGTQVTVENETVLSAYRPNEGWLYAVLDGNGGTIRGQDYQVAGCGITSSGSLRTYRFMDVGAAEREGYILTGYQAATSEKHYDLSEDIWTALQKEKTEGSQLVFFDAQYEQVSGNSIQYIGNGAATSDGKTYVVTNQLASSTSLAGNMFISTGNKYFLGWNTAPQGNGTWYLPGDIISLNGTQVLYARWGQSRVTYHNDEAVETLTDLSYLQPSRLEAVKPNQIFAGWNTQKDGSGTWYSYGDCITPGTVLDLYAQSILRPTDIPYYWLSGWDLPSGKMAEIIQMSSNTDTITLPVTGFGWFRPDFDARTLPLYGFLDQQKGILAPGSSLTINTGTRIQQFRPSVAAILHNNQDSEEHRVFYSISSMGYLMLPDANNTFTAVPEDYIFAGWNTREDGTGEQMESIREPWDHTEVITLYAQWEPAFQTFIQYSGNGAVTSEGEAYVEINGLEPTSTFAQNMFIVPDGKYFLGWNTSPSGNGKWYMPGDTIPLTKNEILYAQWGLCRVTFHDGNFISQSNVMFDYIAPGYTGHPSSNQVFAGWNTAEDGSGTWYRAGMSIVHGAILDLYAQYLTKPETGYYYILSGYSVSPDLLAELKYMDAPTEEITLPKSGIGWTTLNYPYEQPYGFLDEVEQFKAPGSTVTVTSGTIYHSLDNIACATLHKNTGEDNETRVFYRITTRGDLLLPSADAAFSDIPSDLVFTGWNTTADGSGQTLENMPVAVYWPTEYELYAQWEQKEAPEEPDMPPVVRPPHSSAQPDQPMTPEMPDFADVAPTAWYAEAVDYVVEAGLMTGTGGGKFSPEQTVSRAMVMTVLARLAGVDTDGGDTWYEKALVWAVESGITDGSNPTGIITREQLVTMLYRQAGSPTQDTALSGFDDIDTVSPWAKDAMIWAVEHNILNGINGSLVPQGTATRAQMAALFQRILEQA